MVLIVKDEIKKEIVKLLSDKKAREAIEIIKSLNYSKEMDSLIIETIQEMTDEYDLYITKHGRYMNFCDSDKSKNMVKGVFECKRGEYGFVIVSDLESDIFIPKGYKNSAMDGDLVLALITKGQTNTANSEGRIIKVIKRNPNVLVSEVIKHY